MELLVIFGLITTVLWLVIGWRAMRAHERIAQALGAIAEPDHESALEQRREESSARKRLYKAFLAEDPTRAELSSKERHDAFRDWLDAHGSGGGSDA